MRLDLHAVAVARGNADVAARIFDLHDGIAGNLHIEDLLVLIMLGQPKEVEEVVAVVVAPLSAHGAPEVVPTRCAEADDSEQDESTDKASAAMNGGLATHIEGPLAEQCQARSDQQQGPPVSIPGPERGRSDAAGIDEQAYDADPDEDDRAHHRRNVRNIAAVACFPCMPLSAPRVSLCAPCGPLLLTIDPPLRAGIVRRRAGRSTAGGGVRWLAAHDWPPGP